MVPKGISKPEIQRIADFLNDVYKGICEGDDLATMHQQLTELYPVIRLLMGGIKGGRYECREDKA